MVQLLRKIANIYRNEIRDELTKTFGTAASAAIPVK